MKDTRRHGAARARSGILLALRPGEDAALCVARARQLARRTGDAVRVVCVRPHGSPLERLFAPPEEPSACGPPDERARRWLSHQLGAWARQVEIDWRQGDFEAHVAAQAGRQRARLVVLPDQRGSGELAIQLACSTGAQVLVSRSKPGERPILAATDLQDPEFPVLRGAAQLALALGQPLITFHNVDPLTMMAGHGRATAGVHFGVSALTRRESLVGVSQALQVELTPIIRAELDPVHAILDEADVCDAGLIVVGAHPCSWWQRLMDDGVAPRVANQADRDVLITPLAAVAPG